MMLYGPLADVSGPPQHPDVRGELITPQNSFPQAAVQQEHDLRSHTV